MSYTSTSNLTTRYGTSRIAELTGDSTGTTVNTTVVESAINGFAGLMDAALRKWYDLTELDSTNDFLNDLNTHGAYLQLMKWRELGFDEERRKEWDGLMKQIEFIASNKIDVLPKTGAEEQERVEGLFRANPRRFSRSIVELEDDACL